MQPSRKTNKRKQLKGKLFAYEKKLDEAIAIFQSLVKEEPEAALENFEIALKINPNLMDVFTNIISLHASRKDYKTALDKCDAYLQMVEDNPVVTSIILNLKGNLLLATKVIKSAENTFKLAIEKNSQFIAPYLALAKVYNSGKEGEKELQIYKDLIKNRPDQAGPHSFIGTLYEKKGEQSLAEEHYKKALELQNDFDGADEAKKILEQM